jgi:hypothetical protein
MHSGKRELRKTPICEIPRADYAYRRQISGMPSLLEAGFEFVDESLWQSMASTRTADNEGLAVFNQLYGLAN